jgi:hypothetical protein
MSTIAVSLQAQIDALDAELTSVQAVSVGADGVSRTNQRWTELSNQRLKLEVLLARITGDAPMIVRGRVKGLSHGRW